MEQNVVDLMAGGSIGLFYCISGFVMTVGYAQTRVRPPTSAERHRCDLCNFCCCSCVDWCCSKKLGSSDWQAAEQDASTPLFEQANFLRKRVARLAPMYYISNALVLVMWLVAI